MAKWKYHGPSKLSLEDIEAMADPFAFSKKKAGGKGKKLAGEELEDKTRDKSKSIRRGVKATSFLTDDPGFSLGKISSPSGLAGAPKPKPKPIVPPSATPPTPSQMELPKIAAQPVDLSPDDPGFSLGTVIPPSSANAPTVLRPKKSTQKSTYDPIYEHLVTPPPPPSIPEHRFGAFQPGGKKHKGKRLTEMPGYFYDDPWQRQDIEYLYRRVLGYAEQVGFKGTVKLVRADSGWGIQLGNRVFGVESLRSSRGQLYAVDKNVFFTLHSEDDQRLSSGEFAARKMVEAAFKGGSSTEIWERFQRSVNPLQSVAYSDWLAAPPVLRDIMTSMIVYGRTKSQSASAFMRSAQEYAFKTGSIIGYRSTEFGDFDSPETAGWMMPMTPISAFAEHAEYTGIGKDEGGIRSPVSQDKLVKTIKRARREGLTPDDWPLVEFEGVPYAKMKIGFSTTEGIGGGASFGSLSMLRARAYSQPKREEREVDVPLVEGFFIPPGFGDRTSEKLTLARVGSAQFAIDKGGASGKRILSRYIAIGTGEKTQEMLRQYLGMEYAPAIRLAYSRLYSPDEIDEKVLEARSVVEKAIRRRYAADVINRIRAKKGEAPVAPSSLTEEEVRQYAGHFDITTHLDKGIYFGAVVQSFYKAGSHKTADVKTFPMYDPVISPALEAAGIDELLAVTDVKAGTLFAANVARGIASEPETSPWAPLRQKILSFAEANRGAKDKYATSTELYGAAFVEFKDEIKKLYEEAHYLPLLQPPSFYVPEFGGKDPTTYAEYEAIKTRYPQLASEIEKEYIDDRRALVNAARRAVYERAEAKPLEQALTLTAGPDFDLALKAASEQLAKLGIAPTQVFRIGKYTMPSIEAARDIVSKRMREKFISALSTLSEEEAAEFVKMYTEGMDTYDFRKDLMRVGGAGAFHRYALHRGDPDVMIVGKSLAKRYAQDLGVPLEEVIRSIKAGEFLVAHSRFPNVGGEVPIMATQYDRNIEWAAVHQSFAVAEMGDFDADPSGSKPLMRVIQDEKGRRRLAPMEGALEARAKQPGMIQLALARMMSLGGVEDMNRHINEMAKILGRQPSPEEVYGGAVIDAGKPTERWVAGYNPTVGGRGQNIEVEERSGFYAKKEGIVYSQRLDPIDVIAKKAKVHKISDADAARAKIAEVLSKQQMGVYNLVAPQARVLRQMEGVLSKAFPEVAKTFSRLGRDALPTSEILAMSLYSLYQIPLDLGQLSPEMQRIYTAFNTQSVLQGAGNLRNLTADYLLGMAKQTEVMPEAIGALFGYDEASIKRVAQWVKDFRSGKAKTTHSSLIDDNFRKSVAAQTLEAAIAVNYLKLGEKGPDGTPVFTKEKLEWANRVLNESDIARNVAQSLRKRTAWPEFIKTLEDSSVGELAKRRMEIIGAGKPDPERLAELERQAPQGFAILDKPHLGGVSDPEEMVRLQKIAREAKEGATPLVRELASVELAKRVAEISSDPQKIVSVTGNFDSPPPNILVRPSQLGTLDAVLSGATPKDDPFSYGALTSFFEASTRLAAGQDIFSSVGQDSIKTSASFFTRGKEFERQFAEANAGEWMSPKFRVFADLAEGTLVSGELDFAKFIRDQSGAVTGLHILDTKTAATSSLAEKYIQHHWGLQLETYAQMIERGFDPSSPYYERNVAALREWAAKQGTPEQAEELVRSFLAAAQSKNIQTSIHLKSFDDNQERRIDLPRGKFDPRSALARVRKGFPSLMREGFARFSGIFAVAQMFKQPDSDRFAFNQGPIRYYGEVSRLLSVLQMAKKSFGADFGLSTEAESIARLEREMAAQAYGLSGASSPPASGSGAGLGGVGGGGGVPPAPPAAPPPPGGEEPEGSRPSFGQGESAAISQLSQLTEKLIELSKSIRGAGGGGRGGGRPSMSRDYPVNALDFASLVTEYFTPQGTLRKPLDLSDPRFANIGRVGQAFMRSAGALMSGAASKTDIQRMLPTLWNALFEMPWDDTLTGDTMKMQQQAISTLQRMASFAATAVSDPNYKAKVAAQKARASIPEMQRMLESYEQTGKFVITAPDGSQTEINPADKLNKLEVNQIRAFAANLERATKSLEKLDQVIQGNIGSQKEMKELQDEIVESYKALGASRSTIEQSPATKPLFQEYTSLARQIESSMKASLMPGGGLYQAIASSLGEAEAERFTTQTLSRMNVPVDKVYKGIDRLMTGYFAWQTLRTLRYTFSPIAQNAEEYFGSRMALNAALQTAELGSNLAGEPIAQYLRMRRDLQLGLGQQASAMMGGLANIIGAGSGGQLGRGILGTAYSILSPAAGAAGITLGAAHLLGVSAGIALPVAAAVGGLVGLGGLVAWQQGAMQDRTALQRGALIAGYMQLSGKYPGDPESGTPHQIANLIFDSSWINAMTEQQAFSRHIMAVRGVPTVRYMSAGLSGPVVMRSMLEGPPPPVSEYDRRILDFMASHGFLTPDGYPRYDLLAKAMSDGKSTIEFARSGPMAAAFALESVAVPGSYMFSLKDKYGLTEEAARGLLANLLVTPGSSSDVVSVIERFAGIAASGGNPYKLLSVASAITAAQGLPQAWQPLRFLAANPNMSELEMQTWLANYQAGGGLQSAIAVYQGSLNPRRSFADAVARVQARGADANAVDLLGYQTYDELRRQIALTVGHDLNLPPDLAAMVVQAGRQGYGADSLMAAARGLASYAGEVGPYKLSQHLETVLRWAGAAENLAPMLGYAVFKGQLGSQHKRIMRWYGFDANQADAIAAAIYGGQGTMRALEAMYGLDAQELTMLAARGALPPGSPLAAAIGGGLFDPTTGAGLFQRNLVGLYAPGQAPSAAQMRQFFQGYSQWRAGVTGAARPFFGMAGAAFGARLDAASQYGMIGLSALSNQVSFEASMASAGISMAQIREGYLYQTQWQFPAERARLAIRYGELFGGVVQTDWMRKHGIPAIDFGQGAFAREREELALSRQSMQMDISQRLARLYWQLEDIARERGRFGIQTQWQRSDFDFAQVQREVGRRWQDYEISRSYAMFRRNLEWAREDFAFNRQVAELQFGWTMEDYDEAIRYSRGRERRRLIRQRDREAQMYELKTGQDNREKARMEERARLEEEHFKRQIEHIKEIRELEDEEAKRAKERFEEQVKWREEDFSIREARVRQEIAWAQENAALSEKVMKNREEQLRIEEEKARSLHEMEMVLQQAQEAHAEKMYKLSMAAAGIAADAAKKQQEIHERMEALADLERQRIEEFRKFFTSENMKLILELIEKVFGLAKGMQQSQPSSPSPSPRPGLTPMSYRPEMAYAYDQAVRPQSNNIVLEAVVMVGDQAVEKVVAPVVEKVTTNSVATMSWRRR